MTDKCTLCSKELKFFDIYTSKIDGEEQKLCKDCYQKLNPIENNDNQNIAINLGRNNENFGGGNENSSIWITIVKVLTTIAIFIFVIVGGVIGSAGDEIGIIIGAIVGGVVGLISVSIIRIFVDMAEDIRYIANHMKK